MKDTVNRIPQMEGGAGLFLSRNYEKTLFQARSGYRKEFRVAPSSKRQLTQNRSGSLPRIERR